jgi:LmbE family N-acetylglucosaminyl deacetylase
LDKYVLVIAAHPDDELLGCAGTLKRLIDKGFKVVTVIFAKGRKDKEREMLQAMADANNCLGWRKYILSLSKYVVGDVSLTCNKQRDRGVAC